MHLPFLGPFLVLLLHRPQLASSASLDESKCGRQGERFVQDFIQYECSKGGTAASAPASTGEEEEEDNGAEISFDAATTVLGERVGAQLVGRPVGCVPSNKDDGTVIEPGSAHTTKHFRYECVNANANAVALKVTHCVDHDGKLVRVGEFYTRPPTERDQKSEQEEQFTSVECVGNEFLAKKVVHKWSHCVLADDKKLVEGDFTLVELPRRALRSQLQKYEIVACLHEEGDIRLKCTGCGATNGQELAVSRFAQVAGQWTQCRRFKEGCRMINVTQDYIDCESDGNVHKHGSTFESQSRRSLYVCSHGQIIKQGCFIQSRDLTLVGDVKYIDGVTPALCVDNDNFTFFSGIVGCDLPDKRFKRFMEVWRDGDNMKRCSWAFNPDGSIARSEIRTFACINGNELLPLNKVVQKDDGRYVKCAPEQTQNDEGGEAGGPSSALPPDGPLVMRNLTENEFIELTTKKLARQNLVEYFGVGRRASSLLMPARAFAARTKTAECADQLPFCGRLSGYCPFMSGPLERGLALESYSELRDLQAHFDQLGGAKADPLTLPMGCEKQPSTFQKLQLLIELACPQTCQKCQNVPQRESSISSLENSSHCG